MNLTETTVFENYTTLLGSESLQLTMQGFETVAHVMFEGIAQYLSMSKSTKDPSALVISDFKNEMILAAYVYHQESNKDSDDTSGDWNIDFTFNKEDIPENARVKDIKDPDSMIAFIKAGSNNGIDFAKDTLIAFMTIGFFSSIKDWLDQNADPEKVVDIEYPGVFKAMVEVKDGIKMYGITIDETIKKIVKGTDGDELLSRANVKNVEETE